MAEPAGGSVLLTSAGRRVQLVRFFQRALRALAEPGRVLVSEANPGWSAAARTADASFQAPHLRDPGYERYLLDLVGRERIRLIVPTIDTELLQLASMRDALLTLGCQVSVSDPALVATCRDKRLSGDWFAALGFETPRLYDRDSLRFPCFVKPYDGSMSLGARALHTPGMLSAELLADDRLLFMELFSAAEFDEFTADAYYCRQGRLKCLVPRKRVEVRGGEISKGVALKGATWEYLRARLGRLEGARGCLTFQFFVSRTDARVVASELNPRFGGGYPLSQAAGADFPAWLIREYFRDEEVPVFDAWTDRTAMTRFDDEVVFTLPEGE